MGEARRRGGALQGTAQLLPARSHPSQVGPGPTQVFLHHPQLHRWLKAPVRRLFGSLKGSADGAGQEHRAGLPAIHVSAQLGPPGFTAGAPVSQALRGIKLKYGFIPLRASQHTSKAHPQVALTYGIRQKQEKRNEHKLMHRTFLPPQKKREKTRQKQSVSFPGRSYWHMLELGPQRRSIDCLYTFALGKVLCHCDGRMGENVCINIWSNQAVFNPKALNCGC